MADYIINIITPAVGSLGVLGYWIAFFAAMLETTIIIGLFLPGSTVILLLGGMSAYGYFDLGDLLWFAIAGAILGDNINFYLGKKYGSAWAQKGVWFLKQEYFEKARSFFDAHGAKSVFFGRFVPSIKEIMPFIAGTVRMRRRTFLLWNILGAIGWGFQWILAGYIFAKSLSLARMWLSRMGFFVAAVFLLFLIFYLIKLAVLKYGRQVFSFAASVARSIGHAVITNPDVENLVRRHPSFFQFIRKRIAQDTFTGLPLTLLGIAFIYVLVLFGGIVEDYLTGDPIVAVDVRIANLMPLFRTPGLIKLFLWITLLGKWQVVLGFTAAMVGTLWVTRRRWYIFPFFLSVAGSGLFTGLGKLAFHRPRPEWPVYLEHSFSFPSGHATIAVSFYGFITYVLVSSMKEWKSRINLFFAGVIIIFLIGFSRIYLGVHYLSDVWSGYLVGTLWLIIGISLSKYLQPADFRLTASLSGKKLKYVPAVLILSSLVFYAGFAMQYNPELLQPPSEHAYLRVNNVQDIFADEHAKYTETFTGREQNPINIIVIAKNDEQFIESITDAGWFLADTPGFRSLAKTYKAALLNEPYPTAPVTPLFRNARVNDFAFEKPTGADTVRTRHHVRFWKTKYVTKSGDAVYVGAASFDSSVKWGITHRINPDVDAERDYFCNNLIQTKKAGGSGKMQLVKPGAGRNFTGDPFFTDGEVCLIKLNAVD
ncbi:MAG TPA: phosphatase PAP2 family protein [Nitrospirae bacterium]|nr:phosphatase PAP2 family protein [Nitrospirota bacterium]